MRTALTTDNTVPDVRSQVTSRGPTAVVSPWGATTRCRPNEGLARRESPWHDTSNLSVGRRMNVVLCFYPLLNIVSARTLEESEQSPHGETFPASPAAHL